MYCQWGSVGQWFYEVKSIGTLPGPIQGYLISPNHVANTYQTENSL